jgi:hypothetical protein
MALLQRLILYWQMTFLDMILYLLLPAFGALVEDGLLQIRSDLKTYKKL